MRFIRQVFFLFPRNERFLLLIELIANALNLIDSVSAKNTILH